MRHIFQAEQWLPYPVELVFAFFINPQNLPPLMPAWQKARIEEAVLVSPPPGPPSRYKLRSVAAGVGSSITISFRPFPLSPLRIPWEATIVDFVWNESFCDAQEPKRGPFAYWRHCHRVAAAVRDGVLGTALTDDVEYEPPFGAAGELAHSFVRRQIKGIFNHRQRRVAEILARVLAHPPTISTTGKDSPMMSS